MRAEVTVTDPSGQALATVMVTQKLAQPNPADTSDGGYQQPGKAHRTDTEHSAFTDGTGRAQLPQRSGAAVYRLRKPGYQDRIINAAAGQSVLKATLQPETDPAKLAEARPASSWLGALDVGTVDAKRHFQMQCGFCHQQGNALTRAERSPEEWQQRDRPHGALRLAAADRAAEVAAGKTLGRLSAAARQSVTGAGRDRLGRQPGAGEDHRMAARRRDVADA